MGPKLRQVCLFFSDVFFTSRLCTVNRMVSSLSSGGYREVLTFHWIRSHTNNFRSSSLGSVWWTSRWLPQTIPLLHIPRSGNRVMLVTNVAKYHNANWSLVLVLCFRWFHKVAKIDMWLLLTMAISQWRKDVTRRESYHVDHLTWIFLASCISMCTWIHICIY